MNDEFNAGTFVAEQKVLLDKFHQYWVANHIEKPCDFPLEMGGGEWDEQFQFFAGMKREEAEDPFKPFTIPNPSYCEMCRPVTDNKVPCSAMSEDTRYHHVECAGPHHGSEDSRYQCTRPAGHHGIHVECAGNHHGIHSWSQTMPRKKADVEQKDS